MARKRKMIAEAERSNFLRQCWRQGHWKDGVGTLLMPLRLSIYELRRDFTRARIPESNPGVATQGITERAPVFSSEVHPIFCEPSRNVPGEIDLASSFAEADEQIRGMYRFAGGRLDRFDRLNRGAIELRKDAEDIHAYHRLYWVRRYAIAASYGHQGAQSALLTDFPQWLENDWQTSKIAVWPYTLAERIASLTTTLFWIARSVDSALAALIVPIKEQIWRDAIRLSGNVEFHLGVHNHVLNDARGLFLAGAALSSECDQATQWREQALHIWDEYFPQLVLADGTFAEQSSHYHLLLCRTALEYWLASARAGRNIPAEFESRLRSMFDLANELLRADGTLPRFGDISPDCTVGDLWGLLAAAHHHGMLRDAPRHSQITALTLFYGGSRPQISQSSQAANQRLFTDGGFAFLRSVEFNAELTTHGDSRSCVGTHGDAGRGSYEFWWNGNVLVREPGSFLGSADSNWRSYQSAESQNITSLDGLPPAITKHEQKYAAAWYRPEGGAWEALADGGVCFRCQAFRRLHSDISLARTWRFAQPDTLHFEEKLEGSSRVEFESRICLGDAEWSSIEQGAAASAARLQWRGPDGSSAEITLQVPANVTITSRACTFLSEYGVEKNGRQLVLNGSLQLPFSWTAQWKLRKAA
jgi:hypothetical protein